MSTSSVLSYYYLVRMSGVRCVSSCACDTNVRSDVFACTTQEESKITRRWSLWWGFLALVHWNIPFLSSTEAGDFFLLFLFHRCSCQTSYSYDRIECQIFAYFLPSVQICKWKYDRHSWIFTKYRLIAVLIGVQQKRKIYNQYNYLSCKYKDM